MIPFSSWCPWYFFLTIINMKITNIMVVNENTIVLHKNNNIKFS